MSDAPSSPVPPPAPAAPAMLARRSLWRRLRLGWWLLVLVVGVCGFFGWREYRLRSAIAEAEVFGWRVERDDPFTRLKADWKKIFDKATWRESSRNVYINLWTDRERENYVRLLRCIEPRQLWIEDGKQLRDLSFLAGLGSVRDLGIFQSDHVENVDALRSLPELKELVLMRCPELKNMDGVAGLSKLEVLIVNSCTSLQNVDSLAGLKQLARLDLARAPNLTNLDGLWSLTSLVQVSFRDCTALKDVHPLRMSQGMLLVDLIGCKRLPEASIYGLIVSLPKANIVWRKPRQW